MDACWMKRYRRFVMVCRQKSRTTLTRADARGSNFTGSKLTIGRSFGAALSQERIFRRVWSGWLRMPKQDFFSTRRATLCPHCKFMVLLLLLCYCPSELALGWRGNPELTNTRNRVLTQCIFGLKLAQQLVNKSIGRRAAERDLACNV